MCEETFFVLTLSRVNVIYSYEKAFLLDNDVIAHCKRLWKTRGGSVCACVD